MKSHLQGTLKKEAVFEGVGIHTGKPCKVVVRGAEENHGRVFAASDGGRVPARVDSVVKCDRCTILGSGDSVVYTPEHLLSAMAALGIDNALIEMSGPEVPILDGSAATFYSALKQAGVQVQKSPAPVIRPEKPFSVMGNQGQSVHVVPWSEEHYEYVLYYDHPMLGCQTVEFSPQEGDYALEIAPARTFALWEEVKPLLERGLAQGGTVDNALVVYQDKFSSPLTVEREPVRHKCLDLIGDFALLDARIQAKVLAIRAGHKLHVDCATAVWKDVRVCERA